MKKVISALIILTLVFSTSVSAQPPSDESYGGGGPVKKLQRGFLNLADSLVEIPGTMRRKTINEGAARGMTFGLVEGILFTVKRAITGCYEVATFLIPIPGNYGPILDEPRFLRAD